MGLLDAFKAYALTHKDCVFLVEHTYDTQIGVPNAIRVAKDRVIKSSPLCSVRFSTTCTISYGP